jgi:alanine racemase
VNDDPTPEAVIDLAALRANVAVLRDRIAPAQVMLAVKADAYGHGLIEVARAGIEAGATSLAVLDVPTGLALRAAGLRVPMLAWLHGTATDFRSAIDEDVDLGISALWQLEAIAAAGATRTAALHLKVDTGLSRNGATRAEWPDLVRAAVALQEAGVARIRAVWSHLADASVEEDEAALSRFLESAEIAEDIAGPIELRHLAASSAGWRMPQARFDLVRFGIAAYGVSPFDDSTGSELGLRPVMSLCAPVIGVRQGAVGLVRIAAGYADGVPTIGIPRARVLLSGHLVPLVRVEANSTLVDAGSLAVREGDIATFFGAGDAGEPTAEKWADWAQTIADEILTGVPSRIPRRFVN